MTEEEVPSSSLKQGYLSYRTSWDAAEQECFSGLFSDGTLQLHANVADSPATDGVIDVKIAGSTFQADGALAFTIVSGTKNYMLSTSSSSESRDWMDHLERLGSKRLPPVGEVSTGDVPTSLSPVSATSTPSTYPRTPNIGNTIPNTASSAFPSASPYQSQYSLSQQEQQHTPSMYETPMSQARSLYHPSPASVYTTPSAVLERAQPTQSWQQPLPLFQSSALSLQPPTVASSETSSSSLSSTSTSASSTRVSNPYTTTATAGGYYGNGNTLLNSSSAAGYEQPPSYQPTPLPTVTGSTYRPTVPSSPSTVYSSTTAAWNTSSYQPSVSAPLASSQQYDSRLTGSSHTVPVTSYGTSYGLSTVAQPSTVQPMGASSAVLNTSSYSAPKSVVSSEPVYFPLTMPNSNPTSSFLQPPVYANTSVYAPSYSSLTPSSRTPTTASGEFVFPSSTTFPRADPVTRIPSSNVLSVLGESPISTGSSGGFAKHHPLDTYVTDYFGVGSDSDDLNPLAKKYLQQANTRTTTGLPFNPLSTYSAGIASQSSSFALDNSVRSRSPLAKQRIPSPARVNESVSSYARALNRQERRREDDDFDAKVNAVLSANRNVISALDHRIMNPISSIPSPKQTNPHTLPSSQQYVAPPQQPQLRSPVREEPLPALRNMSPVSVSSNFKSTTPSTLSPSNQSKSWDAFIAPVVVTQPSQSVRPAQKPISPIAPVRTSPPRWTSPIVPVSRPSENVLARQRPPSFETSSPTSPRRRAEITLRESPAGFVATVQTPRTTASATTAALTSSAQTSPIRTRVSSLRMVSTGTSPTPQSPVKTFTPFTTPATPSYRQGPQSEIKTISARTSYRDSGVQTLYRDSAIQTLDTSSSAGATPPQTPQAIQRVPSSDQRGQRREFAVNTSASTSPVSSPKFIPSASSPKQESRLSAAAVSSYEQQMSDVQALPAGYGTPASERREYLPLSQPPLSRTPQATDSTTRRSPLPRYSSPTRTVPSYVPMPDDYEQSLQRSIIDAVLGSPANEEEEEKQDAPKLALPPVLSSLKPSDSPKPLLYTERDSDTVTGRNQQSPVRERRLSASPPRYVSPPRVVQSASSIIQSSTVAALIQKSSQMLRESGLNARPTPTPSLTSSSVNHPVNTSSTSATSTGSTSSARAAPTYAGRFTASNPALASKRTPSVTTSLSGASESSAAREEPSYSVFGDIQPKPQLQLRAFFAELQREAERTGIQSSQPPPSAAFEDPDLAVLWLRRYQRSPIFAAKFAAMTQSGKLG